MIGLREALIAAMLAGGAGMAAAQTTTVTTTTTQQEIDLTPAQRTTIYRTVKREPMRAAPADVEVRVGTRVPESVELYSLPETVVTEVPAVRSYKYMTVNDRVLLVDPSTGYVVGELQE
jgi:hypothetical protein